MTWDTSTYKKSGRPTTSKGVVVGDRFEQWVVLGDAPRRNNGIMYLCRCSCGVERPVRGSHLVTGNSTSCGCKGRVKAFKRGKESKNPDREGQLFRQLHCRLKARQKKKGWGGVCLTLEEHTALITKPCIYCNHPGSSIVNDVNGKKHSDAYILVNGVDRLDSSKGYTIENSVSCCKYCNRGKMDTKLPFFLHWVAEVYHHSVEGGVHDFTPDVK